MIIIYYYCIKCSKTLAFWSHCSLFQSQVSSSGPLLRKRNKCQLSLSEMSLTVFLLVTKKSNEVHQLHLPSFHKSKVTLRLHSSTQEMTTGKTLLIYKADSTKHTQAIGWLQFSTQPTTSQSSPTLHLASQHLQLTVHGGCIGEVQTIINKHLLTTWTDKPPT